MEADPQSIETERRQKACADLEDLILAGLNSPASPMTKDDWAAIRTEGLKRVRARLLSESETC